jgi:hypothetical protein
MTCCLVQKVRMPSSLPGLLSAPRPDSAAASEKSAKLMTALKQLTPKEVEKLEEVRLGPSAVAAFWRVIHTTFLHEASAVDVVAPGG